MYLCPVSWTPTITQWLSVTDSLSGEGNVLVSWTPADTRGNFDVWNGLLSYSLSDDKPDNTSCMPGLSEDEKVSFFCLKRERERQHSGCLSGEVSTDHHIFPICPQIFPFLIRLWCGFPWPDSHKPRSHKSRTHNFLLVISLAEVLAVALGAWLVLVVLPPKRVQLLCNASEKRS